jgi:hypothetical protein
LHRNAIPRIVAYNARSAIAGRLMRRPYHRERPTRFPKDAPFLDLPDSRSCCDLRVGPSACLSGSPRGSPKGELRRRRRSIQPDRAYASHCCRIVEAGCDRAE